MRSRRYCRLMLLLAFFLLGPGRSAQQTLSAPEEGASWVQLLPLSMRDIGYLAGINLEPLAGGIDTVTGITHAGDERIFISLREGMIVISDTQGNIREAPFLDFRDQVGTGGPEDGLLGLAFPPDHGSSGRFYVYYTNLAGDSVLSRFSVDPTNADRSDPDSEEVLLAVEQPTVNHKGGALAFGPFDGYLYLGLGDGGIGRRAQLRNTLLGKILRLDVAGDGPYAVPPDNPFVDDPLARDEIWALGLRNPWRIAFDRATGDLFLADVGALHVEEIDFQLAEGTGGENYGWPCYEGSAIHNLTYCDAGEAYVFPVHEYSHPPDGCSSIIGGYVYRGSHFPVMNGHYFFSDFCLSRFWTLISKDKINWRVNEVGEWPGTEPTTFGEDVNGELYLGSYAGDDHSLFRITPADSP